MKEFVISEAKSETAVLVGLTTKNQDEAKTKEYLDELEFLADTAGAVTVKRFTQKVAGPNSVTYIGTGKLEEIRQFIKDNIIDTGAYQGMEIKLALGMISALFASGAWLIIASVFGWPVSTTHTIIGSLIGFALVTTDASSVHWSVIAGIFGSWIITPFLNGLLPSRLL